jgi:hypothetical protein
MTAVDEIKKQVLALGLKDRASLAEFLLSSLPPVPEECSEADELAEADRLQDAEFWQRIETRRQK